MFSDRRSFFSRLAAAGAAFWAGGASGAQHEHHQHAPPKRPTAPKEASGASKTAAATGHHHPARAHNVSFETPDLPKLPFKMIDGVKEFHLVAEVVRTEFMPGRVVDAWGFNGSVPGPTIEIDQGDRVRVIFDNHLPEMTAVHWHGFEVPVSMDGSVGLGQDPVLPGERFVYEFTLHQTGTFFYHSHFAMQEMMGMIGLFIMHPKEPVQPHCDRDFGIILQEWALLPNNTVPNTLAMEFNWLTMNGKAGPDTTPMIVKKGERVRIRLVNMGMDHHPIHLHGNQFVVTGTEAGRGPVDGLAPQNTVLVGVAQARDIEFEAKYTGDWMLHCHLPHHMMNQMMSMVGPMHHVGQGLHSGGGVEEGMGIIRQGNALSEELGPALARGIGPGAENERQVSTAIGPQSLQHEGHRQHSAAGTSDFYPKDDEAKKRVPGYPQDMWMPMDEMFNHKPENYGLRKGWSGAMMGMMTLVRVVEPDTYDKIMELKKTYKPKPRTGQHGHHQHGGTK